MSGPSPTEPRGPGPGVTWRSVLLGLLLIPFNVTWITIVEVRWYSLDGAQLPLFVQPVFLLFALVLLDLPLVRWRPRWAFTPGELLTTYVMLVIATTMAGHDWWQNFFGSVSHPFWFATPENQWQQRFFHYLPDWLAVRNLEILEGFYEGNARLTPEVWQAWAVPLLVWGWLTLVVVAMMLCLNIIVRRQWTENERLTYPIVQLPLGLTDGHGIPLLRDPMLWVGFAIAAAIGLMNGLHDFVPAVPYVNVKQQDMHQYLSGRPWSYMGRCTISFYPFMIGLAYFLPLDLGFSIWFFYLVRLAQQILGGLMGGDTGRFFPWLPEQGAGSWLALAVIALWGSRFYLGEVFRQVLSGQRWQGEPVSYRVAVGGFVVGMVYLIWWTGTLGVGVPTALVFWTLFFLLSLAMTRVRAELGAPHEIYFVNPRRIMMTVGGTMAFTPEEMTWFSASYWFNRCYRCHPMPPQLEAFKMAEGDRAGGGRMENRRLVGVILAATLVGLVAAVWSNLAVCYDAGAAAKAVGFKRWVGQESYNDLSRWLESPTPPDGTGMAWMAGAFVFTLATNAMRRRFLWWPFHPAGYPLAVSFAMDYFWFAVLVAWLLKVLTLKLGGMRAYRRGIPVALGLILGDYVVGSLWSLAAIVLERGTYKMFI